MSKTDINLVHTYKDKIVKHF